MFKSILLNCNLNFCIFLIGVLVLCIVMYIIGYTLGGKSKHISYNPFEGGIPSLGNIKNRSVIKFYIIAIISLIFDIESLYIYPWAIATKELGLIGIIDIFLFIFVLVIGLLYVISKGIFDKK